MMCLADFFSQLFRTTSPNAVNITYELHNFPWAGPSDYIVGKANNASFLALWFNSTCT